MTTGGLGPQHRSALGELAPVLRRAVDLDARVLARLRLGSGRAGVLVRLPFGVLVARTVECDPGESVVDVAVLAAEALHWIEGDADAPPVARDLEWRTGVPPQSVWTRLDTVPDEVIRPLVRQGALALTDAAAREGVPGAQPRAEVADALLDSVVLSVQRSRKDQLPSDRASHGDRRDESAEVTLRALSALTRMGFLARGGAAHVDIHNRWIRVVGTYGTVYLERPGASLTLR